MAAAIVLLIGSVLVGLGGFVILSNAQSAIHEIEPFILLLIASVLSTGAFIVEAVSRGFKEMTKAISNRPA